MTQIEWPLGRRGFGTEQAVAVPGVHLSIAAGAMERWAPATRGVRAVLHVDHIVPWSKGGATEEANLRTLCAACNLGKSDELPTAMGTTDEG